MGDGLSYDAVGATRPDLDDWPPTPTGLRRHESRTVLGRGDWDTLCAELMVWGVKTRSGFSVHPAGEVEEGADLELHAHLGPLRVVEPIRVVAVVTDDDRCGFAYGTRVGHPVRGEEAFVVHRDADGLVRLTLRSLTGAAPGRWRPTFPALLLAQRVYRSRYRRALDRGPA